MGEAECWTIIKGNGCRPELVQEERVEKNKRKKTERKKRRGRRGRLVQITRLVTESERQPRAKSDLPFTDLSDLVPRRHLLQSALQVRPTQVTRGIQLCTHNVMYSKHANRHPRIEAQEIIQGS